MTSNFKLESHHARSPGKGGSLTEAGENADSALKDLIQLYYDVVR